MIRQSSAKAIADLIADLGASRGATRDAAIARLTVIGARAVARVLSVAEDPKQTPLARVSAIHALGQIGDDRAVPPLVRAIGDAEPEVALAAIAAAAPFLESADGARVLDVLIATALDRQRPTGHRVAAIQAVKRLRSAAVAKALRLLNADPDPAVATASGATPLRIDTTAPSAIDTPALNRLPDEPARLRRTLVQEGATAPITVLGSLIESIRVKEAATSGPRRGEWTALRAAVHLMLAQRGSRLALHDARDTVALATTPVAVEFLATLKTIGDASCLEAVAAAFDAAAAKTRPDALWLRHLSETFQAIVVREHVTRRHASLKRIEKRWPQAAARLIARP